MKTFRLLALFVVILAAVFVTANVAVADNGATTTHFTAAYDNGPPGFFTCAGERIVKTGPKAFVKDSETCATTGGRFVPNGTYTISPGDWFSDYELFTNPGGLTCFNEAVSGTITVKNQNGGTSTWTIVAYYDPAFTC
jgi:hypothetical protein